MTHNTREVEEIFSRLKEYNLKVSSPHPNQDDEEVFSSILHHQLQKAREEERERWLDKLAEAEKKIEWLSNKYGSEL